MGNGRDTDIIVLFLPRAGKKCNWPGRILSLEDGGYVEGEGVGRDARRGMNEGEKSACANGRPFVITMIRNGPWREKKKR